MRSTHSSIQRAALVVTFGAMHRKLLYGQCHLAYLVIMVLTCGFVIDGQPGSRYGHRSIDAGQTHETPL
jgi:hypothetical protein